MDGRGGKRVRAKPSCTAFSSLSQVAASDSHEKESLARLLDDPHSGLLTTVVNEGHGRENPNHLIDGR